MAWPRALGQSLPEAEASPRSIALPFSVSLADLAAQAGPELARSLGFGMTTQPARAAPLDGNAPEPLPLCILHDGSAALRLELDATISGPLAARMFGAAAGEVSGPTPGTRSASWQALRKLVSEALREAFVRAGARGELRTDMAEQPTTAPDGENAQALLLSLPEAEGLIWLRPAERAPSTAAAEGAAPPAPPREPPDRDPSWRRRAELLARQTELGITLQIAELRLPIAAVSCLKPGDILPIRRPRQLRLMSGGAAIAALPSTALGGRPATFSDGEEEGQ